MSRVGKQPVVLPDGVKAVIAGQLLKIEGPKGKLEREVRQEIAVKIEDGKIVFEPRDASKQSRAFHGLERSLANNMVEGVFQGFERQLEFRGVGYRAEVKGDIVNLSLGYSQPIDFKMPPGVKASSVKEGREIFVKLESIDKQLLGQVAAQIRSLRPPEPYKGKGVRYRGEHVRTKAGKAGKK